MPSFFAAENTVFPCSLSTSFPSMVSVMTCIFIDTPWFLLYDDCIKLAPLTAISAFDTFVLINSMGLFLLPGDGIHRTVPHAYTTARTRVRIDPICNKRLAYAGWAFIFDNMGLVFMAEKFF